MTLTELLQDSNYELNQFTSDEIKRLEDKIVLKNDSKGRSIPHVQCLIRKKEIKLTPEEVVRQLFLDKLINHYGYNPSLIDVEVGINFGREVKRADIIVYEKSNPTAQYIIVELKKPKLKDGKDQLKSYCNATGAPLGVWTNGKQISYYNRKDPNYFEDITDIPSSTEKIADIISERITYDDLKKIDKLQTEKKSL